jgi:3-oxoacyl-[acyl-carrier protein] reductase
MKNTIRTHDGRVALVTGAGQGIGQAIASALAERGAKVIATDLTPPHETVRRIGPTAYALQLDVTREEDWQSVSLKSREIGGVDIVVNNAGYFPNRAIDDLDLSTWRKTMATNLDSHFLSVKYFLPAMRKKKWGRFVGISSNMIGLAIPGMSQGTNPFRFFPLTSFPATATQTTNRVLRSNGTENSLKGRQETEAR